MPNYGELAPMGAFLQSYTQAARAGDQAAKQRIFQAMQAASNAMTQTVGAVTDVERLRMLQAEQQQKQAMLPLERRGLTAEVEAKELGVQKTRSEMDKQEKIDALIMKKYNLTPDALAAMTEATKSKLELDTLTALGEMGQPKIAAARRVQEEVTGGMEAQRKQVVMTEEDRAGVIPAEARQKAATAKAGMAVAEVQQAGAEEAIKQGVPEAEQAAKLAIAKADELIAPLKADLQALGVTEAWSVINLRNAQAVELKDQAKLSGMSPSQMMTFNKLVSITTLRDKLLDYTGTPANPENVALAWLEASEFPSKVQLEDDLSQLLRAREAAEGLDFNTAILAASNTAYGEMVKGIVGSRDTEAIKSGLNQIIRRIIIRLNILGENYNESDFIPPEAPTEGGTAETTGEGATGADTIISNILKNQ